jgi:predicted phosphodiesterase
MSRVLVVGDCHCPGMLKRYPEFLAETREAWDTDEVVLIGDVVDWQSISFHEKDPSLPDAKKEFEAAKAQVQTLYELFPSAHWLIGNHDALSARKAHSAGLPDFLLRPYGELWEVPGWKVYPRFFRLEIDGVVYTHGDQGKGGQFPAVKNSRDNFVSWVSGHHHSEAGVWYTVNQQTRVFGLNVGCGMDHELMQFEYGRKFNRKPAIGAGVVLDGTHAYWEPMIL